MRRPSRSYLSGKRGRHKHRDSPETKRWEREHLVPARPEWMDTTTYTRLGKLRADLDRGGETIA